MKLLTFSIVVLEVDLMDYILLEDWKTVYNKLTDLLIETGNEGQTYDIFIMMSEGHEYFNAYVNTLAFFNKIKLLEHVTKCEQYVQQIEDEIAERNAFEEFISKQENIQ